MKDELHTGHPACVHRSRPFDSRWDVSGDNRVTSSGVLIILKAADEAR